METSRLAVATITWARSPDEEARLVRSLGLLARTGMPVAVADRGTSPSFAAWLAGFAGVRTVSPKDQGLVSQVHASFAAAAAFDTPFVLYTEADKQEFFERGVAEFLRRAPDRRDIGVVVASRSPQSFGTYPPMQRYTEDIINTLCGAVIGLPGDYSYGPFVISTALLPHVARLDPRLGWGWRHAMFVAAHRQGLRVVHVTGEYSCALAQRDEDDAERKHRLRQLSQNLLGLIE